MRSGLNDGRCCVHRYQFQSIRLMPDDDPAAVVAGTIPGDRCETGMLPGYTSVVICAEDALLTNQAEPGLVSADGFAGHVCALHAETLRALMLDRACAGDACCVEGVVPKLGVVSIGRAFMCEACASGTSVGASTPSRTVRKTMAAVVRAQGSAIPGTGAGEGGALPFADGDQAKAVSGSKGGNFPLGHAARVVVSATRSLSPARFATKQEPTRSRAIAPSTEAAAGDSPVMIEAEDGAGAAGAAGLKSGDEALVADVPSAGSAEKVDSSPGERSSLTDQRADEAQAEPDEELALWEKLAVLEKQVAQLKGDKALLSAEKGESQERAARLADAAARTSAPASAGLARGSGSAVKSSVDSAEARRRTSAADVMSLVRGEDLRAVVDEAGSASPMEKLGALMQDAEADETRPPTDAELAELTYSESAQARKEMDRMREQIRSDGPRLVGLYGFKETVEMMSALAKRVSQDSIRAALEEAVAASSKALAADSGLPVPVEENGADDEREQSDSEASEQEQSESEPEPEPERWVYRRGDRTEVEVDSMRVDPKDSSRAHIVFEANGVSIKRIVDVGRLSRRSSDGRADVKQADVAHEKPDAALPDGMMLGDDGAWFGLTVVAGSESISEFGQPTVQVYRVASGARTGTSMVVVADLVQSYDASKDGTMGTHDELVVALRVNKLVPSPAASVRTASVRSAARADSGSSRSRRTAVLREPSDSDSDRESGTRVSEVQGTPMFSLEDLAAEAPVGASWRELDVKSQADTVSMVSSVGPSASLDGSAQLYRGLEHTGAVGFSTRRSADMHAGLSSEEMQAQLREAMRGVSEIAKQPLTVELVTVVPETMRDFTPFRQITSWILRGAGSESKQPRFHPLTKTRALPNRFCVEVQTAAVTRQGAGAMVMVPYPFAIKMDAFAAMAWAVCAFGFDAQIRDAAVLRKRGDDFLYRGKTFTLSDVVRADADEMRTWRVSDMAQGRVQLDDSSKLKIERPEVAVGHFSVDEMLRAMKAFAKMWDHVFSVDLGLMAAVGAFKILANAEVNGVRTYPVVFLCLAWEHLLHVAMLQVRLQVAACVEHAEACGRDTQPPNLFSTLRMGMREQTAEGKPAMVMPGVFRNILLPNGEINPASDFGAVWQSFRTSGLNHLLAVGVAALSVSASDSRSRRGGGHVGNGGDAGEDESDAPLGLEAMLEKAAASGAAKALLGAAEAPKAAAPTTKPTTKPKKTAYRPMISFGNGYSASDVQGSKIGFSRAHWLACEGEWDLLLKENKGKARPWCIASACYSGCGAASLASCNEGWQAFCGATAQHGALPQPLLTLINNDTRFRHVKLTGVRGGGFMGGGAKVLPMDVLHQVQAMREAQAAEKAAPEPDS